MTCLLNQLLRKTQHPFLIGKQFVHTVPPKIFKGWWQQQFISIIFTWCSCICIFFLDSKCSWVVIAQLNTFYFLKQLMSKDWFPCKHMQWIYDLFLSFILIPLIGKWHTNMEWNPQEICYQDIQKEFFIPKHRTHAPNKVPYWESYNNSPFFPWA